MESLSSSKLTQPIPDADSASGAGAASHWSNTRERSNRLALAVMVWIALRLGRRVARAVLIPITLYFLFFAPGAKRNSRRFLDRALGRKARLIDGWRHVHTFASVVLDRVYFARGEVQAFDLRVTRGELVDEALAEGRGAFMLGAHMGSFEALHALGESRPGMRVAMVMYPDNARMIQSVLHGVAPEHPLSIISVGRAGSTLAIRDWLDGGGLVGVLGDRFAPNEAAAARSGGIELPFLGRPARFSDGPMRLAQLLRRRVIFMVGLYRGGRQYDVRFRQIADFRQRSDDPTEREHALRAALAAYAAELEGLAREAPYNWFNFHDFWGEERPSTPRAARGTASDNTPSRRDDSAPQRS